MDRRRIFMKTLFAAAALLMAFTMARTAAAQFGGGGQGGFGGGGEGGGFGGQGGQGGQGGGIPDGAGVVIDAAGVLRLRSVRDPRLGAQRLAEAHANLPAELQQPSLRRKVSLNRLEAALGARHANGLFATDEMKYLAGLQRIEYVMLYPETGDVVIAGQAEGFVQTPSGRVIGMRSGRPVLELQDLAVAMRAFPPSGPPTRRIGVSIDPTPQGLTNLQQFLAQVGSRATPRDTPRLVEGMRQSLGKQTVTISGIDPRTHFAQVLTEADYRMKLIGIGLEVPPARIRSYISRANPATIAANALLRWYFVPHYDSVRVSVDELAMRLEGDGVRLVGKDEVVTDAGDRVGVAITDRAGQAFVLEFTKMYPQLAANEPVFAQLRNLVDLAVAAAFMQKHDYFGKAGWSAELLLDEQQYPTQLFHVPAKVETAVNAIWRGNRLMTPIGGGVHINATKAVLPENVQQDNEGEVRDAHDEVALDHLAPGEWWWD